jgi:hypothetical protein
MFPSLSGVSQCWHLVIVGFYNLKRVIDYCQPYCVIFPCASPAFSRGWLGLPSLQLFTSGSGLRHSWVPPSDVTLSVHIQSLLNDSFPPTHPTCHQLSFFLLLALFLCIILSFFLLSLPSTIWWAGAAQVYYLQSNWVKFPPSCVRAAPFRPKSLP